jgi:hypothetical protein
VRVACTGSSSRFHDCGDLRWLESTTSPFASGCVWARCWSCWASCRAHAGVRSCGGRAPCMAHARRGAARLPPTSNGTAGTVSAAALTVMDWISGWRRPDYLCTKLPWTCVSGFRWRSPGCPPEARRHAARLVDELPPDRAVELQGLTEARQGRTLPRKLRRYATTGPVSPRGFRASLFPTSFALIGRRHGVRGIEV